MLFPLRLTAPILEAITPGDSPEIARRLLFKVVPDSVRDIYGRLSAHNTIVDHLRHCSPARVRRMGRHVNAQGFDTPDGLLPGKRLLAVVDLREVWPHVAPGGPDLEVVLLVEERFLALSTLLRCRGLLGREEGTLLRHVIDARRVDRGSSRLLQQVGKRR